VGIADKDDWGSEFPLLQFSEFDPSCRQVRREFPMFWIAHAGRKLAALIRALPENLPPGHILPQPSSLAQRTTNVGVPKCITKKTKKIE
jgi:hypothetical protein